MALRDKSLFMFGLEVNATNNIVPFKISGGGTELDATITSGFYTLQTLATEIARAMAAVDPTNTYTVTIDRTAGSNLQNRVTISTGGAFLSLLFSSSVYAGVSITNLINFGSLDLTGATTYTNSLTTGTALRTTWFGRNYQPPSVNLRTIGVRNMAADGTVETTWWSVQQLIIVEFQYEAEANVLAYWQPLILWMAKGRPFEFTPEVSSPTTYYSVTLDKSTADGKGLGMQMKEMLPDFPFLFTTGPMDFRLVAGTY